MQLTRQILHVIGFDGASVLMPSLVWAAVTSMMGAFFRQSEAGNN